MKRIELGLGEKHPEETFFLKEQSYQNKIVSTTWQFWQTEELPGELKDELCEVILSVDESDWEFALEFFGILLETGVTVIAKNGWLIGICNGNDCERMVKTLEITGE